MHSTRAAYTLGSTVDPASRHGRRGGLVDPKRSEEMLHKLNTVRLKYYASGSTQWDTDEPGGRRSRQDGGGRRMRRRADRRAAPGWRAVTGSRGPEISAARAHALGPGARSTREPGAERRGVVRSWDVARVVEHVASRGVIESDGAAWPGRAVSSRRQNDHRSKLCWSGSPRRRDGIPRGTHDWTSSSRPMSEGDGREAGLKVTARPASLQPDERLHALARSLAQLPLTAKRA